MYKSVLFISDNEYMCKQIENIIFQYKSETNKFSFAISPFSDHQSFTNSLSEDLHVCDLRNSNDIDFIINNYDLVISVHCKQLFPKKLINHVKCINIHPGYNPSNRGWYPQVFSILNDDIIGATIHEIDEEIDHGPIIARETVIKDSIDTSGSLYDKILQKEIELFEKHFSSILDNSYAVEYPENEGKLYLKKDFNDLCKLDLNEISSLKNFIQKMKALTHKDFKNAFFIDEDTNEKVYVSINIRK